MRRELDSPEAATSLPRLVTRATSRFSYAGPLTGDDPYIARFDLRDQLVKGGEHRLAARLVSHPSTVARLIVSTPMR